MVKCFHREGCAQYAGPPPRGRARALGSCLPDEGHPSAHLQEGLEVFGVDFAVRRVRWQAEFRLGGEPAQAAR